jgi:ketosteroid isomerase-like protein
MSAKEDILALENRRYRAMVDKDFATLADLLADDLVYTHSNAVVDGKASYIEGIRAKRWDYAAAERPEENIETFGDCARVTGHVRLTLNNADGSTRKVNGRFLNMWVRRAGRWQMVAWQSTPIPA